MDDDDDDSCSPGMICFNLFGCIPSLTTMIITAVNIARLKDGNCEQIMDEALLWVALSLGIVTTLILGFARCLGKVWWCTFVLVILYTVGVTAFGLTVTHGGGGEALPGKAYKEYRLPRYSKWVQKKVNNTKTWSKIETCLVRHRVCEKRMARDWANTTLDEFYTKPLSSIESGCCKPSNDCNFSFVTPTNWTATTNSTYTNPDCHTWNNDPNILCFNCQSCKAGVADKYKRDWFVAEDKKK